MSGTWVKICGITRQEDARVAAECGAWAAGLVFYPKSPRFVTAKQALHIVKSLPPSVLRIGVFMDASVEVIRRVERTVPLDLIQIHGRKSAETAKDVAADRVILATVLETQEDVEKAQGQPAAYLLVDRRRVAGRPSGPAVNWALARQLAQRRPRTLLAGALTPENVGEGIKAARPWGVDVSGGVESAPGVKDPAKIRAFFDRVRRTDAEL